MRIILPLFFEQDEYLARRPKLLELLARQAAAAGRSALRTVQANAQLLLTHDHQRTELASDIQKTGDVLLPIKTKETLRPPNAQLLPPGASSALAEVTPEAEVSLFLNPRCPALDAQVLAAACFAFARSEADVLLSARLPEDHPCQGKRLFTRDRQRQPIGKGITIQTTSRGTTLIPDTPCPRGAQLLIWQQSGRLILSPEADSNDRSTRFIIPPGCRVLENATWGLLHSTPIPGPGTQMEPFTVTNSPWQIDHCLNTVINARTGRRIAGRQDFPETLIPDNNFCLIKNNISARWQDLSKLTITAFQHDPELPALIKDEFSELAWTVLLDKAGH